MGANVKKLTGLLGRLQLFMIKNEKSTLLYFIIIALFLRTFYVVIEYNKFGTEKWADAWEYLSMGQQIARGNWDPSGVGLPHMQVGPGLPLLIAFFQIIFGTAIIPIFIYNIIITSIIVPVLFYLGKFLFERKVGWFLALWGIFNMEFLKYNPHVLKESTVFLFLPLTILFLVKGTRTNESMKFLFFSSLSYVFLIHFDERYIIYFPIFPLIYLLISSHKTTKNIKLTGFWIGLVLLFMLPWGIRNYKVFNQIVFISPRTTIFTSKLWGNNLAGYSFDNNTSREGNIDQSTIEFSKKYGIIPYKCGKFEAQSRALINFWQPAYFNPTFIEYGLRPQKWSISHNAAGLLYYGIFLPFYLIGFAFIIKGKKYVGLFIAFIPVIHSFLHAYMVSSLERYRSPVNFIVVMIGIYTMFKFYEGIKKFWLKISEY